MFGQLYLSLSSSHVVVIITMVLSRRITTMAFQSITMKIYAEYSMRNHCCCPCIFPHEFFMTTTTRSFKRTTKIQSLCALFSLFRWLRWFTPAERTPKQNACTDVRHPCVSSGMRSRLLFGGCVGMSSRWSTLECTTDSHVAFISVWVSLPLLLRHRSTPPDIGLIKYSCNERRYFFNRNEHDRCWNRSLRPPGHMCRFDRMVIFEMTSEWQNNRVN